MAKLKMLVWLMVMGMLFPGLALAKDQESSYERVLRTGTLRCGYVVYSPSIIKDPNTGELSGIFYEITELMAQRLNLKVEWTQEIQFPTMVEDMRAQKFDALCLNGWGTAHLAPYLRMMSPLYYSTIHPYVRSDDLRFDHKLSMMNDPQVKISTIDGTGTSVFAQQSFPKAQRVSLPQMSDYSMTILDVVNKKADVVLVEDALAAEFLEKNPGSIRRVLLDRPLRYYANSYYVGIHENALHSMLDMTLGEMLGSGEVARIVEKYDRHHALTQVPLPFNY